MVRFLKIKGLKPCLDQKAPQKSVFHLAKPLETSILEPNKTEFSFLTSNSNPKEAIKEKKPQNNFEKVNTTPVNESHLSFFKSENSNPHSNANASLNSILNIGTSAQKSSDSPKLVKQSLPFIVEYHNPQSKATSENTYEKVPEKAPEEQILFNNKIKPEEKILNPTEKNSNEKITKNIEEKFSQEKTLNKNVEDHKTENDQTGSKKLFGFKTENDSLTFSAFSNTNNNNPTHPSLFQQTSLFQQPSTNLFGSNAIKPTTNLFGNTPASGNLFGNLFQQKPNENSSLSFLNNLKKGFFAIIISKN